MEKEDILEISILEKLCELPDKDLAIRLMLEAIQVMNEEMDIILPSLKECNIDDYVNYLHDHIKLVSNAICNMNKSICNKHGSPPEETEQHKINKLLV